VRVFVETCIAVSTIAAVAATTAIVACAVAPGGMPACAPGSHIRRVLGKVKFLELERWIFPATVVRVTEGCAIDSSNIRDWFCRADIIISI